MSTRADLLFGGEVTNDDNVGELLFINLHRPLDQTRDENLGILALLWGDLVE